MDTPNPNTTSRPIPPATQQPSDLSFNVMPQDGSPGRMSSPPPPTSGGGSGDSSSVSYDNPSSSKKWIYILVAIIVLLGLGAAAYYMLGTEKSGNQQQAVTTKLPKVWLTQYFNTDSCTDQNTCGDNADPDNDGSTNHEEFKASTIPINPDTDKDGLADGDEANIYKTDATLKYTDRRETVAQNDWVDGFQIKNGYDPLTPGLKFTEARKKQIADDTTKFKLHEPSTTTLGGSSSTPSPSPSSSTPASWKTYTNSQLGFSLKYPNDWELSTQTGYVQLYPPRVNNKVTKKLEIYFTKPSEMTFDDLSSKSTKVLASTTWNTAKIMPGEPGAGTPVYYYSNDKLAVKAYVYVLEVGKTADAAYIKSVEDILATFEFPR